MRRGLFIREQTGGDGGASTGKSSGTQNNRAFDAVRFVAVGRQEMRSRRGIRVRAELIEEPGPRPGGEYESLINRPRWAYGNEEQFIQCDVSKLGGICGYPPPPALSLFLTLFFHKPLLLFPSILVKQLIPK